MAAGKNEPRLKIKHTQKLPLPSIPDTRPYRADIRNGQDQQQLQPLGALHNFGKILDGFRVVQIAALGKQAHIQMMLNQPGHRFGLRRRQAEPGTDFSGNASAGDRVVLYPPLGDVVQEGGDVKRPSGFQRGQNFRGDGMVVGAAPMLDIGQNADRAHQMLVHRIVMIHVELHHRDDAAEGRHKTAEHAGLVHAPQGNFGISRAGQKFQEQPVGFLISAQLFVDQLQRGPHQPKSVRMKQNIIFLAQPEQPDEIDRVLFEHPVMGHIDAAIVDPEI